MFEKTKARLLKFEESHDEARVVVEHVKRYQLVYAIVASSTISITLCRMSTKPSQIVNNFSPTISVA